MKQITSSETEALKKELLKVSILDLPGFILVGLALYAKFDTGGEPFHPILKNGSVVTGMFIVGGAIVLWGMWRVFAISKRLKALQMQ